MGHGADGKVGGLTGFRAGDWIVCGLAGTDGCHAIIMGVVGAIGLWWWRADQVKGAAGSIVDAAGKALGM